LAEQVAVLGGGSLTVPDYAAFLAEHYLADYLPAGGAAVKLAVAGSPETAGRLERALGAAADAAGCLFVSVPAAEVKVHQVEQLLFAVSRHTRSPPSRPRSWPASGCASPPGCCAPPGIPVG